MKIVIVEDEIRIREGIARLIKKLDNRYEIVGEAENGAVGLTLIREVRPDVIITDIKMPVMDGLEMLEAVYGEGICAKVIVLSAYSEFEYARTAMRMGVKEYLLKPIVVGDISDSLRRVDEELAAEKRKSDDLLGSLEQIFRGILTGTLEVDAALKHRIEEQFSIPSNSVFQGICLYLGKNYDRECESVKKELKRLLTARNQVEYVLLEWARGKMLVLLVYRDSDMDGLERWVQYWLLQDRSRKIKGAVGYIAGLKLEELKSSLETLFRYMDWNIVLGDGVMISYPKITKLQTSPCIYPLELEKQMKLAVCAGQRARIQKSIEEFTQNFCGKEIYDPNEIKECYVRFLWAMINTGKELGILDYEKLEQQKLLEQIMGAKTAEELSEVGIFLLEKLMEDPEEISHLTIKRAKSMIQEFYQTGITLDEIAEKLNLTPEYLGTVFHREMGLTFSSYIKNIRITKAKELLISTSLKQYEIAQSVGYADPKYFSKVFKEATGQLPAQYRKTHR